MFRRALPRTTTLFAVPSAAAATAGVFMSQGRSVATIPHASIQESAIHAASSFPPPAMHVGGPFRTTPIRFDSAARQKAIAAFPKDKLSEATTFVPRPPGFTPGMEKYDSAQEYWVQCCYGYAYANYKDRMNPEFIVYATCEEDISLTVKYCNDNNIAVAVRTGSHHYIGASSSCPETVVIDVSLSQMKDPNARKAHPWSTISVNNGNNTITAGCSADLGRFADQLHSCDRFLPFGQCKPVCVGGHSQSGGNGPAHTAVVGYLSDYIQSMRIIMADGTVKTLYRSDADRKLHNQTEDENHLFWALAGASPGSFGVCTSVTFSTLKNQDWDAPLNYSRTPYSKEQLKKIGSSKDDNFFDKIGQWLARKTGQGSITFPCKVPYTRDRLYRVLQLYAEINDSMADPDQTKWKAPIGTSFTMYVTSAGGPRWTNLLTGQILSEKDQPQQPTQWQDKDDFMYRKDVFNRMIDKADGDWSGVDLEDIEKNLVDTPLLFLTVYCFRPKNPSPDPNRKDSPETKEQWTARAQKFFNDLQEAIDPTWDDIFVDGKMWAAQTIQNKLDGPGPQADPANSMSEATLTTTFPVEKEYLRAFEKHNSLGAVDSEGNRRLATNGFATAMTDAFDELFTREKEREAAKLPSTKGVLNLILGGPGTNPGDGKNFESFRGQMKGWCEWETWWSHTDKEWANDWSNKLSAKMHDSNGDKMWCDRQLRLVALPYGSDDIMNATLPGYDQNPTATLAHAYWENDDNIKRLAAVKAKFDPNQTFSAGKFGIGGQKKNL